MYFCQAGVLFSNDDDVNDGIDDIDDDDTEGIDDDVH